MRAIADGQTWKMPATIDDPAILDEITESLAGIGYPQASRINYDQLTKKTDLSVSGNDALRMS